MTKRIVTLLAAVALAFTATPAMGATTKVPQPKPSLSLPSPFVGSFTYTPELQCGSGETASTGSAFRVSDDLLLTAHHLIDGAPCSTGGQELTTVIDQPELDFTVLRVPTPTEGFRVVMSCEGIRQGERYLALGYALGVGASVTLVTGTGDDAGNGQVYVTGRVYPGQSGGPVLNFQGAVVGVVSAYLKNLSVSVITPLSATAVCKNGKVALK